MSTAGGHHDSGDDAGDHTGAFVEHVHVVYEDGEDVQSASSGSGSPTDEVSWTRRLTAGLVKKMNTY